MALNEFEEYRDYYEVYGEEITKGENQEKIKKARKEMHRIKGEDKFLFTPRFLSKDLIKDHLEKCENTIGVINRILKETREGEKTPLQEIIPKKRQHNIPHSKLYEKVIELVDPRFPSIMESRIDGCILEDKRIMAYEVNANRAGWENSRSFCDIYNRYFSHLLPGHTVDFADGWESIIKYVLKKVHGDKTIYLTEQRGKESIAALRDRGIDIDFVRFQNIKNLMKNGDLRITKDDVTYKGERVNLICRFLRTHQVLALPELCECVKNGNVHLINQMDAFYGGLKTLLIKLRDPEIVGSYSSPEDIISIPESALLRDIRTDDLIENKDRYVLKFGNRGGGKAVYFGVDRSGPEWVDLIENSRLKYPETAMIQERVNPSLTPSLEDGSMKLQKTTCDVFVFTTDEPKTGGVFSRWSHSDLVNFKTGGIKETVFV
ncbi:MAG: hypothetical protein JW778_06695 [Candidatus Altiarchaeota archaeon]|nr:hypothetical protein [Candidatus Altiarchaeota archaeon]